jgi:proline iminopeptidase
MQSAITEEGYIDVPGGSVYYKVVGDGPAAPLLTLHGGPGFPHDYLEPLEALSVNRAVVFYDQLGCGRSTKAEDPSLWTIERYALELQAVRDHLGLSRVHLFGHSWGAMLALDYALTWPSGLLSLIFASPCISIPYWMADARRYREALPQDVEAVLSRGEEEGDFSSPAYQEAAAVYNYRHVCSIERKPDCVARAEASAGHAVYFHMWGPNEFTVSGTLADYDRSDRLEDISIPVLYTCGRYDEASPDALAYYDSKTPNSQMAIFEESAHLPHVKESARYNGVLGSFLAKVEQMQEIDDVVQQQSMGSRVAILLCMLVVGFALLVLAFTFL